MKNWQKKLSTLALASCVTLMASGSALAVSKSAGADEHRSAVQQKAIQWLTVMIAKKASIRAGGNGFYELRVAQSDLARVVGFSDRPVRDVKDMSADDLGNLFNKGGSNSFKKDPPNAILVYNNSRSYIVEIVSSKKMGGYGVFTFKPLKSNVSITTGQIKNAVLTIDSSGSSAVVSAITSSCTLGTGATLVTAANARAYQSEGCYCDTSGTSVVADDKDIKDWTCSSSIDVAIDATGPAVATAE